VQGPTGQTGVQGVQVAGAVGSAGPAGYQGERGATGYGGAQGAAGVIERWALYQDFTFDRTETRLTSSQVNSVAEIAEYMESNPSLEIGIDGSLEGLSSTRSERELSNARATSLRDALIRAGVSEDRIQVGAFANPNGRQQGEIHLLIRTQA